MKVLVTQSSLTLCDPLDCSLSGSSVHGILQARILEWVAIPFSRGSSRPRDWTQLSYTAGIFFTVWATREAHSYPYLCFVYWMVSLLKMEPCLILSTYQNAWPGGVWSTCDWWMNKWKWGRSGSGFYESRIDSELAWILIQPLTCGISSNNKRPVIHLGNGEIDYMSFLSAVEVANSRRLAVVLIEKQQLSQSREGWKSC